MASLDTGKLLWQRNILEERGMDNLQYGMSGSPLVVDDRFGAHQRSQWARGGGVYGKDRQASWEGPARQQGYASLASLDLGGRTQVVNLAGTELVGLDPATGEQLWSFPWDTEWS